MAMEPGFDGVAPPSVFHRAGSVIRDRARTRSRLYEPQLQALEGVEKWFSGAETANETAVVVMPTGSGKTGVICCLPYFLASANPPIPGFTTDVFNRPILVIAPDLNLQQQLEKELHPIGSAAQGTSFLLKTGIVTNDDSGLQALPVVHKIDATNQLRQDVLRRCDIFLTNPQKWHTGPKAIWEEMPDNHFSIIIVDEAHHLPATMWKRIVDKFTPNAKVVFFTATPYRADGQPITNTIGVRNFAYQLQRCKAESMRIIRTTSFTAVHCIDASNKDALIQAVVDRMTEKDDKLPLPGGKKHVAMIIVGLIADADEMAKRINDTQEFQAAAFHGKQKYKDKIMAQFKKENIRILVVVNMLLEGFDHPPVSIAAIGCHITSPVRFAQFVGRAQRVVRCDNEVESPDICADIITLSAFRQERNHLCLVNETLIAIAED